MGRNSNHKLGAWDQLTRGFGQPGQMTEAEERQLGSRKEDGSSRSMCG